MRDSHIKAIEQKIYRIKTYKRIGKMLLITVTVIAGINLVSNIDDAMTEKEIHETSVLSHEKESDNQSVNEAEKVAKIEQEEPTIAKVGEFTITHYCPCTICCGKTDGATATGTQATANRTIAVDPKVIPLGTQLIIDGQTSTLLYRSKNRSGENGNFLDQIKNT